MNAVTSGALVTGTMPGRSQFYGAVTQSRILKLLRSSMGSTLMKMLDDPAVTEISINSDGSLWVDRVGEGRRNSGTVVKARTTPFGFFRSSQTRKASTSEMTTHHSMRSCLATAIDSSGRFLR